MATKRHSKLIIIGSGPAGYTAAHLCRARHAEAAAHRRHPAGGQMTTTTEVENYPGFADVIQGPWLMEQMRLAGRACRHRDRPRPYPRGRSQAAAVRAQGRQPHRIHRRCADHRHRRQGALARAPVRATLPGLWRLGLRHLRRLLLPRQESDRGRRRQHCGRGGALSRQHRQRGDPRASARRAPRREDPARAAVRTRRSTSCGIRARRGARATDKPPLPSPASSSRAR